MIRAEKMATMLKRADSGKVSSKKFAAENPNIVYRQKTIPRKAILKLLLRSRQAAICAVDLNLRAARLLGDETLRPD